MATIPMSTLSLPDGNTYEIVDKTARNEVVKRDRVVNLLDNSDFSNLIMQAGLNGTHGSIAYIADRWRSVSVTATSYSGYTTLATSEKTGRIVQKLPDTLAGKTVTAAAKVFGSSIVYCGIYYTQNSISTSIAASVTAPNGVIAKSGTIPMDATNIEFRIYVAYTDGGGVCDVYWAALYEGEYTTSTLPDYQPKGYVKELAECQRYYYRLNAMASMVFPGTVYSSSQVRVGMPLPQLMRIKPTVTIANIANITVFTSSGPNTGCLTELTSIDWDSNSAYIGLYFSHASPYSVGIPLNMRYNTVVEFSADL